MNLRRILSYSVPLAAVALLGFSCNTLRNPIEYVDPMIGTDGTGHTFPGVAVPFGMVQLSPDTDTEGWDHCSGYHYADSSIMGFSHTHLSGTGSGDLGDILFMPRTGEIFYTPGPRENPDLGYRSRFTHLAERATPGYYAVYLEDPRIKAELTATARTGFHRYTFEKTVDQHIIIDLAHGIQDSPLKAAYRMVDPYTIEGWRRSEGWADRHTVYFCARFSVPVVSVSAMVDSTLTDAPEAEGRHVVLAARLPRDTRKVEIKVGLSGVDLRGAAQNLEAEAGRKDFNKVMTEAARTWNESLSRIKVDGDEESKKIFYTALYHTMLAPALFSDTDGRYRGSDRAIHRDQEVPNYTIFSLWDTFRAVHPLFTIIDPERNQHFIASMLRYYQQTGRLPVWDLHMRETNCMIGNHAIPVIADAYIKGQRDFDATLALRAMTSSVSGENGGDMEYYRRLGYVPCDRAPNSVSETLEYAYDDWCIAQMARAAANAGDIDQQWGENFLYVAYIMRAQQYKTLFDPETGFFRGRTSRGTFRSDFDPDAVSALRQGDYTEGNAWHYAFFAPQDIGTHIRMAGGDEAYIAKLDMMFDAPTPAAHDAPDVTGLIGQYAHGNEPSHHAAYLYSYAGAPWITQQRVNRIMDTMYGTGPDGLCGNEDCGQMSAWYVFSAMGFYPVTPGSDTYVLGVPRMSKATIHLGNGKSFTAEARGLAQGRYVQSVRYNGHDWPLPYITHEMIESGGRLVFTMGPEPNKEFGANPSSRPQSRIVNNVMDSEQLLARVVFDPYIDTARRFFPHSITVRPGQTNANAYLTCTTDGSLPGAASQHVDPAKGITLTGNMLLRLCAVNPSTGRKSDVVSFGFYRSRAGGAIATLLTPPSPPYDNPPAVLTDLATGGDSYTDPGWLGFSEGAIVTLDLGHQQYISEVGYRALNNHPSWIMLPREASVEVSHDGVTFHAAPLDWSRLYRSTTLLAPEGVARTRRFPPRPEPLGFPPGEEADLKQMATAAYYFSLPLAVPVTARYIRFRFTPDTLPSWHFGRGNKAWIFLDELTWN